MGVEFATDGPVAVITLNRPEKLNAISTSDFAQLREAWCRFRDDDTLRVAVITGAGERAFSSGADLREGDGSVLDAFRANFYSDHSYHFGTLPEEGMPLWKPTIAAIRGYCYGAGMTLVSGMDIRLCSDDATFAFPEVRWGVPTITGAMLLPRTMPLGWAAQILYSGDPIDAQTALRIGYVNNVYPASQLVDEALALAQRIARNAPLAVRATKEAMMRSLDMPFEQAFVLGEYLRRVCYDTDDANEGIRAFVERREPQYRGK